MKTLAFAAALIVTSARGAEISKDRLCKAIADTPQVAVSPRDRAFFEDKCECLGDECVYIGGARHRQLRAAARCNTEVLAAVERELGYEPGDGITIGDVENFREFAEHLCLKHGSAPRVLRLLRPAMKEEKRLEAAREEEERRQQAEMEEREGFLRAEFDRQRQERESKEAKEPQK